MECPKCNKDTCVMVTTQNKKKVKEKKGLFQLIVGFPVRAVKFVWHLVFGKKKENYVKETHWNCRYCGHNFKADKED